MTESFEEFGSHLGMEEIYCFDRGNILINGYVIDKSVVSLYQMIEENISFQKIHTFKWLKFVQTGKSLFCR